MALNGGAISARVCSWLGRGTGVGVAVPACYPLRASSTVPDAFFG
jgi:hypothetical protein